MITEIDADSRIAEAMRRIVSGSQFGNKVVVSLPVMYPSGSHAPVEIEINGNDCFVSDTGQGFSEANNYGAADFYKNTAKAVCERFGTQFDGLNMFILKTSVDQMESAIVTVANASVIAAREAFERASIEKGRQSNAALFERFVGIFGERHIAKEAEIQGNTTKWPVHNMVSVRDNTSIFEYVADHHASISSKFMMFSDLSNAETPIIRNAVVEDTENLSEKGQLIKSVSSNVVLFDASIEDIRKYAKAA